MSEPANSTAQPFYSIVVGTDFSQAARTVVQMAADLAAAHRARLTIVHGVDPLITTLDILPQTILDDAQAGLARERETVSARGVKADVQVRFGKSWTAINDVAAEIGADLVIVGSHGRSGLAKLALGSTADRVLRSCGSPVLMIPIGRTEAVDSPPIQQWGSAIVGVDFSEESILAAQTAARLLSMSKATSPTLVLFHTIALTIEFRAPEGPIALPQHWDNAEAEAKKQLQTLGETVRSDRVAVQCVTYRGYPSDGLLSAVRERGADFIAMGTHGRGVVNRLLLGSIAERVLHESQHPVLTVRHPAHAR